MTFFKFVRVCVLIASSFLLCDSKGAQSPITTDHFNAGASGATSNDSLIWANGALFAKESGYYRMNYATNGTYAGYFQSGFTMNVLPATSANLGPVPFAPALGSFIDAKMTLISAPEGGQFDFWLTGATTPSYVLNPGESTPLIPLSDASLGAGQAGADPYGHIHGRRISATVEGDYIVDFQLFDVSKNGPGGGPIYGPSDHFQVDFRALAIPEPVAMALFMAGAGLLAARAARKRSVK